MKKINVEDARAGVVMDALVGNCCSPFEIQFTEEDGVRYLVRDREVPREVYLDALHLAQVDRFDPMDRRFDQAPPQMPIPGLDEDVS